jgi:hypothetical protein
MVPEDGGSDRSDGDRHGQQGGPPPTAKLALDDHDPLFKRTHAWKRITDVACSWARDNDSPLAEHLTHDIS